MQIYSNSSVYWFGDFNYSAHSLALTLGHLTHATRTASDGSSDRTFTIFVDAGSFSRKRQTQDALLKVDGDAFISGPLNIVLEQTPPELTTEATVPVIAIVSPSGTLTGQFADPINVALTYPKGKCSRGSATQSTSAAGLSVLVSVDGEGCKSNKGLSTGAKVAIGVVVGVVGLLIILLIAFFALRRFAPRTARRCALCSCVVSPQATHTRVGSAYCVAAT